MKSIFECPYLSLFLQFFLTTTILCFPEKKRKYFWFVYIGTFLLSCIGLYLLDYFLTDFLWYLCIIPFLLNLGIIFASFDFSIYKSLFYGIEVWAIQNIGYHLTEIIFLYTDFMNFNIIRIVGTGISIAFAIFALFFITKNIRTEEINIKENYRAFIVAGLMFVIAYLVSSFWSLGRDEAQATLIFRIMCIVVLLVSQFLCSGIFAESRIVKEKKEIEQILHQEEEVHKMTEENIELINIKCHDLKKQIHMIRHSSQPMKELNAELKEVENNVSIYDKFLKTGNSNLDIVMAEKGMLMEKYKVTPSFIIDGKKLSFMSSSDIYSLYGNLIDNALEALKQVDDEAKRIVSMQSIQKGSYYVIHMENYCDKATQFQDGLPLTTKDDKKYHGFGTKSIKLIVEKYHGQVIMEQKENVFSTNIILPLAKN